LKNSISTKQAKILGIIAIGIVLMAIVATLYSNKMKEEKTIRIGYQPFWSAESNIVITMKNQKLIERKGYQPEYVAFLSGPPINEALISGALDMGFGGDMPTISLMATDFPVKIVASPVKSLRQAIVVDIEKTGTIKDVKDLAGKKVAVVKGSCSHYFLYKVLLSNGVDPKSVDIINMDVKEQPPALTTHSVDAVVSWEPWPTKMELAGIGKILIEGSFNGFLNVREDFANRNTLAVQAVVDSLQEALEYSQDNFNQTCRWVAEETKDNITAIYRAAKTDRIFNLGETVKPDPDTFENLKDKATFMFEQGLIQKVPNIEEKIDMTFADKAVG
jgi:sulfonate transport system substrate-binding protein